VTFVVVIGVTSYGSLGLGHVILCFFAQVGLSCNCNCNLIDFLK